MLDVMLDTYLKTFHLAVDFHAETGRTTVLLGESGAGKSTVLRLLAGLLHPIHGHISLDGTTYFDSGQHVTVPPQDRPFGYVFQDYVLFPHLTIFENIAFGLRAQRLPRHSIEKRVRRVLEQVNLAGLDQRYPAQLSGGQQQRSALARALVLQPRLLLLDEPLAALDVQTRREVRQELRRILAELSITTLMVTHQYLDALLFGDQILVVDQGHIIQQGGQRELREYPRSSYIAELVGVNFLRGHILSFEASTTCIIQITTEDGHKLPVEVVATLKERGQDGATQHMPAIGSEAFVIIDPRSVTLHPLAPESSARNTFRGTIIHILQQGGIAGDEDDRIRVSIALHNTPDTPATIAPLTAEITAASAERMQLREGTPIYATFKATEALAYT